MSLSANHFELFNLPVAFEIDNAALAARYRDLQRSAHPDNYANASEREQRLALQTAAQINEAFQTLKDPMLRARYLLELQGINLSDEKHTLKDVHFLMDQMELRENLAEIMQKPQPFDALNQFIDSLEKRTAAHVQQLAQACAQAQWDAVVQLVQKLQFFKRIREEALDLEETLNV